MAAFVREFFADDGFPQVAAIGAGERHDEVLMTMGDRDAVVNAGGGIVNWLLRCTGGGGGEDVDGVAQDNRRGMAFAGQGHFPADVFSFTPSERWLSGGRSAGGDGAAPVSPGGGEGIA